jgi:uncharacterized protein YbjT (DUF2867 family)
MILVTGAAGTVGSEIVKGLTAAGAAFKVGFRNRKPAGVDAVALDLDRPETIAPALAGCDSVFLLSNTVAPELNLVRAARDAGVGRVVKLSVFGAAEEAVSFARWHRPVERAIEESGLAWTFLRPNGFMQNLVNFLGAGIREQSTLALPADDAKISHVDARDVAAVAVRALTEPGHAGKAYTLTGPEALDYGQIAQTLSSVLGRTLRYISISSADYRQASVTAGVPEGYADALADLFRYYRTGAAAAVSGDVQLVTGRAPIAFEQFARDHADALR